MTKNYTLHEHKFLPFPPPEQASTFKKKAKGIKKKINDSFLILQMLSFYDYKTILNVV